MTETRVEIDGYPVTNYGYRNGGRQKYPSRNELRNRLFEEFKQCYFCLVEMTIEVPKDGEPVPDTLATIDHLKGSVMRNQNEIVPKVLACYKCNSKRAILQNPNNRRFNPDL